MMLSNLLLSTALANPPKTDEYIRNTIAYQPAEITYSEDFTGGEFLFSKYFLEQSDVWGRFTYEHVIEEFAFDDGSVIMIEVSPTLRHFGWMNREGSQYVFLGVDCDYERECKKEYRITMTSVEGSDIVTDSGFKANPQLPAEALTRVGRRIANRLQGNFYSFLEPTTSYANVLDEKIEARIPNVLSPRDLRRVESLKQKLLKKIETEEKD